MTKKTGIFGEKVEVIKKKFVYNYTKFIINTNNLLGIFCLFFSVFFSNICYAFLLTPFKLNELNVYFYCKDPISGAVQRYRTQ